MTLSSTLQTAARIAPANPAITEDDRSLSYGELEAQVASIAGALIAVTA